MSTPPPRPKIYHITHVNHLPSIIADDALHSDAAMIVRGGASHTIGMSAIKQRRLQIPVRCATGTVGEYVPFYFCPRSVMLYVIHCANNPDLSYRGGQGPIVHLEADLHDAIAWAEANGRPWAFALSNAGAYYTEFRASIDAISELNWRAIVSTDFRSAEVKEGKQAEFLMYETFPWDLVSRIGVRSIDVRARVEDALRDATHRPRLEITPSWYY
jgi:hypothetical protein